MLVANKSSKQLSSKSNVSYELFMHIVLSAAVWYTLPLFTFFSNNFEESKNAFMIPFAM